MAPLLRNSFNNEQLHLIKLANHEFTSPLNSISQIQFIVQNLRHQYSPLPCMSYAKSSITVHFATWPPVRELSSGCGQKRIMGGSIRTEATYDCARTLDNELILSSI